MYQVLFRPEAQTEFTESLNWYGVRSQSAAIKFKEAIEVAVLQLRKSPKGYPNPYKKYYQIHLSNYPFTLVY